MWINILKDKWIILNVPRTLKQYFFVRRRVISKYINNY